MRIIRMGVLCALVTLGVHPQNASGQDARLSARLDSATLLAVDKEIAAARDADLPVEPLIQKALEGAAMGAANGRIVTAVRGLHRRLREARTALGASASPSELVAGAGVLYVDVPLEALRRIKEESRGASADLPFVVLADLVQRGVPPESAVRSVEALARAGAKAEGYHLLRYRVEADIQSGTLPATAAERQSRKIVLGAGGGGDGLESI